MWNWEELSDTEVDTDDNFGSDDDTDDAEERDDNPNDTSQSMSGGPGDN